MADLSLSLVSAGDMQDTSSSGSSESLPARNMEKAVAAQEPNFHALFKDKTCRKFAEERCDDIDLLVISRKVASSSITAIAVCLHVDDTVTKSIQHDSECQQHCDKIHKLLIEWKGKSLDNGTWADLIQCLDVLGDEPLLEGIKEYLHQKESSTSSVGAVRHEVPCRQEINASSVQSSVELCSEDHSDMSALVTGTSSVAEFKRATPVNRSVKKRMNEMEEKFADVLEAAHTSLQDSGTTVDVLRMYVTQLSVSRKESIPHFSKHMAEIISTTSHSQIFALLSRMGAWSVLNFHLLYRVIDRYGNEQLKGKVSTYSDEVNAFKSETSLEDYLRVWSGRSAYGSLPDHQPLIVKYKGNLHNFTLADVAEAEGYLTEEFLLEPHIMHLSNAKPGSVILMWLIPSTAIPLIKRAILDNRVDLSSMKICELIVGSDTFAYKTSSVIPKPITMPQEKGIKNAMQSLIGADYATAYKESIQNPEKFWGDLAKNCLYWEEPFVKVMDCNMEEGKVKWFTGGKLNVSVNCLDRHVEVHPDRIALIWEKNIPGQHEKITYRELLEMTCRIANVLKQNGIKKGNTVVIYMPAHPLTVASMLACTRIGAIHSVVFSAFDANILRERMNDANARAVITANQTQLGQDKLPLKTIVDEAVAGTGVETVFVANQMSEVEVTLHERDVLLEKEMAEQSTECPPEPMDSEDKLFIMYTSGTSNRPKGIVHTHAGYLLYAAVTHMCVFNYEPEQVFACVADLGWITGHTYVVYGPLCNGGTTVLIESTAMYQSYDRYWEMVERLKVDHFYTTPATIRCLMKAGDHHVNKHDLSSLKTIGSVGEPLTEGAWKWYYEIVGKKKCTLLDTWWQTETGGIAIVTPYPAPARSEFKHGFPMKPFFGVEPVLVDKEGKEIEFSGVEKTGRLCLKKPLPGMGRDINGAPKEYKDYFQTYPGFFFTYDAAQRNADGDYRIIGRVDDIRRIKGALQIIPDIENAMNMSDPAILDSYLIGYYDHEGSKRNAVFVQLKEEISEEQKQEAIKNLGTALQRFSSHDVPNLIIMDKKPKTHSGKIVRHILTAIAPKVDLCPGEVQGSTSYAASLYDTEINAISMEDFLNISSQYVLAH